MDDIDGILIIGAAVLILAPDLFETAGHAANTTAKVADTALNVVDNIAGGVNYLFQPKTPYQNLDMFIQATNAAVPWYIFKSYVGLQ